MQLIPRKTVVDAFKPGMIIWRPLKVLNGVMLPELEDVEPTHQESKTSFFRTLVDGYGQGIIEPVVNPYNGPNKKYGIITFLRAMPQGCWTHLVVLNTGRGGNCINVIPECLPSIDDYIFWRRQIDSLYVDKNISGAEELAQLINAYQCPGLRADRQRIQLWSADEDCYGTLDTELVAA